VAVRYSTEQLAKTYLSLRQVITTSEQERVTNLQYDTVSCETKGLDKVLFLLFVIENLDHIETDSEKEEVISYANRLGKNTIDSFSDTEVGTFLLTTKGILISSLL
jgi:hypothetical protein